MPTSPRGNQPTSLIAATTDPHRRAAESGIRAPKDQVILVEGRTDEMALKKHCSFDGITFKAIGKGEGKKEIVHQVSVHPDYMGLVDMDHDFYAKVVGPVSNLVDTRHQCCLYSFISRRNSGPDYIIRDSIEIIKQLSRVDPQVGSEKPEILQKLRNNGQTYSDFVRERTMAKLFKGQMGERRIPVEKGGENAPNWQDVTNKENPAGWVRDLIGEKSNKEFVVYKNINRKVLYDVGVRDHDLYFGIAVLLESQGIRIHENRKWKIRREIGKMMQRKSDNSVTNHFLKQLGLL